MNIVIVGATSGIGRELWKQYVSLGHNVAVVGRRSALLEQMKHEFPQQTLIYPADIQEQDNLKSLVENISSDLGTVDMVVISAGVGDLNPGLSLDKELPAIRTNVLGWTGVVDSFFNLFYLQGKGHLVTITSVGGLAPSSEAPAYSASKAYQINYTRSLQKKAKGSKIYVTEIRPGLVDTAMAKGEGLFWVMSVEKVARQIIQAISKKKKLAVVTKRWLILAWIIRFI